MKRLPSLEVKPMTAFQGFVTRMMGRILGLKGEAHIVFIQFANDEEDVEPTINDIVKNNEEDAINRVRQ